MIRASDLTTRLIDHRTKPWRRLLHPIQFHIKIGKKQIKDRILRILQRKRLENRSSLLVLQIVFAKILGQIKSRLGRGNAPAIHRRFQLPNTLFLRAAGNAHEKTKHLDDARKRINVIVVEAKPGVCVRHLRIELLRAQKFLASVPSAPPRSAILAAQAIETRLQRQRDPRIEMHFGRIFHRGLRGSQPKSFFRKRQIFIIARLLSAFPRINQSPLQFERRAIHFPPARLVFEKEAKRLIGSRNLERAEKHDRAVRIATVQLLKSLPRFRRQNRIAGTRRRRAESRSARQDQSRSSDASEPASEGDRPTHFSHRIFKAPSAATYITKHSSPN